MSTRYVWGRYNTKTIFKNLGNSTAGIWMGTNGKPESTNIIVPNPDGDGEIYGLGGSGIENGQYKYWIIKTYPDLLPTAGEEEGSFGWSNLWASDYILGGTITVDTTAEQILDTINITDRDFINAKHVFVIITPATINSLSRVSFLCKAYRRNLDVFSMIMRGSIKTMTIGYFPSGEFYDRGLCYKNGNLGAVSFYFCNTNEQIKGEYRSDVSGPSQSSYPSDGMQGSYWYTYLGSDSIDPTAVGYNKTTPKGGEIITINVSPRSNTYGGTITYKYEVQLSGGTWTDIGSTTSTAKRYVIPFGTTTFRARVKASDNMGFTSTDYVTGNQIVVINNTSPVISGTNSNLGTFTYNPPIINYTITDENNDTVTVTVKLDSSIIDTRTVTLGQTYTVPINWWDIGTGIHMVTITANDGQGGSATRTYTFTKNSVGLISFNRLHKKTDSSYQTTYIETDSDSIITNNGQVLSERLESIASRLSVSISTTPTEMVSRHRLHIKLTSEYTIDYLEMYSTNVKVGSNTLESILTQLESKVGISNSGTVPSNLNFERWRMKNSSGGYDIIYLEGVSEHIIRPCGKSVEESLQAIEAKL